MPTIRGGSVLETQRPRECRKDKTIIPRPPRPDDSQGHAEIRVLSYNCTPKLSFAMFSNVVH